MESWSGFGMAIRTNNDAEGLHNRWMRAGKAVKLTFYRLSQLIFKEASMLPVQIKLVSHNKLIQAQKATTINKEQLVYELWDKYNTNIINSNELLLELTQVIKPNCPIEIDRPEDDYDMYDELLLDLET